MALRFTGNRFDAEDMVQETFYAALKKFDQLRDNHKCKSWLFAILRSIHLKELRRSFRKQKFEHDESVSYIALLDMKADKFDTEKALEKKITASRLHRIVEELPEKYKSPILLYYMEDMSYREISQYLEIPAGTVMSRLSRAKDMLKKEVLKVLTTNSARDNVVELNKITKHR